MNLKTQFDDNTKKHIYMHQRPTPQKKLHLVSSLQNMPLAQNSRMPMTEQKLSANSHRKKNSKLQSHRLATLTKNVSEHEISSPIIIDNSKYTSLLMTEETPDGPKKVKRMPVNSSR